MAVVTVRRKGTSYADLLKQVNGGIGVDMAEDILSVHRGRAESLEIRLWDVDSKHEDVKKRLGETLQGKPPSARIWLVQCGLYVFLMFTMKIIITLLMQFSFWENVRDLMLSPITNEYLELALVMLIIPLFVNSLMFWVIDDFLMKRTVEAKRQKGLLQTVKVHYHKLTRHEDNADDDDGILSVDDELLGISSSLDNSPVHIDSPNVLVVN
ncbi:store-operated calcium entry regulator STIMATE-like [Lycorma delicatula]|uniref:store-operated calcium entry regulator STIMATE-like n=1 Tax=Lycorma delicatula TaxID=130591 RepID=UPI003F515421